MGACGSRIIGNSTTKSAKIRRLPGNRTSSAKEAQAEAPLGRLRLILALDALLVEKSVNGAAARLGLGAPAMSRLLKQIRELYGDQILVRTAQGMIPTPFAESLRLRVRAVASEAEDLTSPVTERPSRQIPEWKAVPIVDVVPLGYRPKNHLEGQPLPIHHARRLASIGHNADPMQRLAKHIATTAAGVGSSRPLDADEAQEAFSIILEGHADPAQTGALLATMHYRGLTAGELAGFVRASRQHIDAPDVGAGIVDLDLPIYLSPRSTAMPWLMQAGKLLAQSGIRVLLHGFGKEIDQGKLEAAASGIGIPVCTSMEAAPQVVETHGIGFMPLTAMTQRMPHLPLLYRLFQMRTPVNLMLHLLNPLGAPASLLGVAQPANQLLHRDTAHAAGLPNLAILGSVRDVGEFNPYRPTTIYRLVDGKPSEVFVPSIPEPRLDGSTGLTSLEYWQGVWENRVRDERPRQIVIDTAAAALLSMRPQHTAFDDLRDEAAALWRRRRIKG